MEPNFQNGEYILTDKVSYRLREPERGDVVVFHSPQDQRVDFIKRIVGVPGDTIEVKGGYVYIDGEQMSESFIHDPGRVAQGKFLREGVVAEVPPNQYVVMGDNRLHSSDSREWGFVPKDLIVGRAFFRYWPAQAFGVLPTTEEDLTVNSVQGVVNGVKK